MSQNSKKYIQELRYLISEAGDDLNIIEEQIDIDVQKEYFKYSNKLPHYGIHYDKMCADYLENIDDIFIEETDLELKRSMLTLLARIPEVHVYRTIEAFAKLDTPLKSWATISLLQSRMILTSSIVGEGQIYISTGLGGKGKNLRYFVAVIYHNEIEDFQYRTLVEEVEFSISNVNGQLEDISRKTNYTELMLLLPADIDVKSLFDKLIQECNNYGDFLDDRVIISNIKKLSEEEIADIIR